MLAEVSESSFVSRFLNNYCWLMFFPQAIFGFSLNAASTEVIECHDL
jgi:hypothetical protein